MNGSPSTEPAHKLSTQPVEDPGTPARLSEGAAVALSGGGYRAMLFHLGFLWRLYDSGLLKDVERISSVSGGSITSAALALAWDRLGWSDNGASYRRLVAEPVIALARKTIDMPAGFIGRIPALSGTWIRSIYDQMLFHGATLQQLPDKPRFVFNATSLHSGKLFRFSKPFLAEWTFGRWLNPTTRLSEAVAASSAFPPVLSPVTIRVSQFTFDPEGGQGRKVPDQFRLTDGGVYDNLGLETVWKRFRTLYVSDGGKGFAYQENPSALLSMQALRVTSILQDQIGMLRARQMIDGFNADAQSPLHRKGFLVGIGFPMKNRPSDAHAFSRAGALSLAGTPTRLQRMDEQLIQRLVNWGYILADDRMRGTPQFGHVRPTAAIPFPQAPV